MPVARRRSFRPDRLCPDRWRPNLRHPVRMGTVRRRTGIVVLAACLAVTTHGFAQQATPVRFVIGDRMPAEGGDFSPDESPLLAPFGVDFDADENLYVAELTGGRVFRLDRGGELRRIAGDGSSGYEGDGGPAADATFNGIHNAVVRDRQLLIADSWNHCVRAIDLDSGRIRTLIGTGRQGDAGDGGPGAEAEFDYVMCIELTPDHRRLHLTDLRNRRIREFNFADGLVRTVAGNGQRGVPQDGAVATESPLVDPRAAAADAAGNLYVLERGGHALRVVRPGGVIETVAGTGEPGWGDGPALAAQLNAPKHLCVGPDGSVYVADDQNAAIRRYDPVTGTLTTLLGRGVGDPDLRLKNPHGVRFHRGDLYVVDTGHNRVLKLSLPTASAGSRPSPAPSGRP